MTIPSVVALILIIIGLFRPSRWLLICAFGMLPLGSLAILPTDWTGGISLLCGTVAALFLIIKVVMAPGGVNIFLRSAFNLKSMALLTLFTAIAVIGAFMLPKIFIGQAYVFPIRATLRFSIPEPLQPTNSNFTQAAYLIVSFLTAVLFSVMVRNRDFSKDFGTAILVGGIVTIVTGLLDMVTNAVGAGAALDMFRTASYAFLIDDNVGGVRRIVGLMPEASAYGSTCVTFFGMLLFGRNLYSARMRGRVVMPVALACGVLAALSTSSTAYVSLAVLIVVYFFDASRRLGAGSFEEKSQALGEFAVIILFGLAGLIALLSFSHTRETMFSMIDTMLFKKTASGSFAERSSWNTQALKAFGQTNWMGVGVGGVRTSDFFINILASTGIVGSVVFAAFIGQVMFARAKADVGSRPELVDLAKFTLLPLFAIQFLAGTTPDYGIIAGALFGVAIGASQPMRKRVRQQAAVKLDPNMLRGQNMDSDVAHPQAFPMMGPSLRDVSVDDTQAEIRKKI